LKAKVSIEKNVMTMNKFQKRNKLQAMISVPLGETKKRRIFQPNYALSYNKVASF